MGQLGREGLLKREELKVKKVDLDEGDFVYVKQMTGRDRDRFDQSLVIEKRDKKGTMQYERNLLDFRAKLAVFTLCDEGGNLLLTMQDVGMLSQNMSAARLEKIINEAQELNRITEEDKENMLKNSEDAPVDDSGSDYV